MLWDTMRGLPVGGQDSQLQANWNGAEYNGYYSLDLNATGFKYTHGTAQYNGSGDNYIYIAIRRPHKPASQFSATDLFNIGTGVSDNPTFQSGFPTDMGIEKNLSATDGNYIFSRLTGDRYLKLESTSGESTGSSIAWDYQDGLMDYFGSSPQYRFWAWRRAPGFFDVVPYKGTGSTSGVVKKHNLGVTPELIIRKSRDHSEYWFVWSSALSSANLGAGNFHQSFGQNQYYPGDTSFYGTAPTATEFVEGIARSSNIKYVAYLFASVPGLSKIGTYTGTGSDSTIDCGFTNGARFVLIKRTDSSGHWYVMDTVQGITVGNDPAWQLNEPNTSDSREWLKPDSSGFIASDYFLTINGATYLFFAIA